MINRVVLLPTIALMIGLFLSSCATTSCQSKVETLSNWIARTYECEDVSVIKDNLSFVCGKEDKPQGIIGSLVCEALVDFPLTKLNSILEDAKCKDKIIGKEGKDFLVAMCKNILPFEDR